MKFDKSPKKLLFKAEARAELLKGVKQLADAVSITMGPGGQTVVIDKVIIIGLSLQRTELQLQNM